MVAAAGAVAAVVLAITLRRRTRGRVWPWALAGVVAWVVGPVYVGGTFMDYVNDFRLYADSYTLAHIYAAAEPFHPASCPNICTRADIPPAEAADGAASDPPGTLTRIGAVGGEQLVDTDGNERYDVIR
ncbi:MAG: hypothetical protein U0X20_31045, partial [Caldilineaceae bacterium]